MNNRKVYTAPAAEVVLLAPVETLAAFDWNFDNVWKNGYVSGTDVFSAVGIINGGAGLDGDSGFWEEDGFVIKK